MAIDPGDSGCTSGLAKAILDGWTDDGLFAGTDSLPEPARSNAIAAQKAMAWRIAEKVAAAHNADSSTPAAIVPTYPSEDFESGIPTGSSNGVTWSNPSARFPGDLAWTTTTSSPLAGTRSACIPAGSSAPNSNASLGLQFTLWEPARVLVRFKVQAAENADFLRVYVDGNQPANEVLRQSSGSPSPAQLGRYCTDILQPGQHTIDFRFTRSAGVADAAQLALVDDLVVRPESRWDAPDCIRDVDLMLGTPNARWSVLGSGSLQVPSPAAPGGALRVRSNASPARMAAERLPALWASLAAGPVVMEWRLRRTTSAANFVLGVGVADDYSSMANSVLPFFSDSSSPAYNTGTWWMGAGAGSWSAFDTGLPSPSGTDWANVRIVVGPESATLLVEGKALQTAPNKRVTTTTVPSVAVRPLVRLGSNDANVKDADVAPYLWLGPRP